MVVVDELALRHFRDEARFPDVSVTYDDHLFRVLPAVLHGVALQLSILDNRSQINTTIDSF